MPKCEMAKRKKIQLLMHLVMKLTSRQRRRGLQRDLRVHCCAYGWSLPLQGYLVSSLRLLFFLEWTHPTVTCHYTAIHRVLLRSLTTPPAGTSKTGGWSPVRASVHCKAIKLALQPRGLSLKYIRIVSHGQAMCGRTGIRTMRATD